MALCENEGTKSETMALFKMPGGFAAGYVMIRHIEVQYPNKMVLLMIGKYASEAARRENIDNCVIEGVGFPVTAEALDLMRSSDDRDVFYPYLEAQILFLAINERKALENWTDEYYNELIQATYDELGIENPYAPATEAAAEEGASL